MIGNAPYTPEAALVTAIIMQAYRDLFVTIKSDANTSLASQTDQDKAIAFLTDNMGRWAQHRNHLCWLIGLDGNVLAERVRRMMQGGPFPDPYASSNAAVLASHAAAIERVRDRYQQLRSHKARAA